MKKMNGLLLIPLAFIAGCCTCPPPDGLPKDVQSFIQRRDQCDSLRGEVSGEPQNAEQDREMIEAINQACKGTDRELATLRMKYPSNQKVIDALSKYEGKIE